MPTIRSSGFPPRNTPNSIRRSCGVSRYSSWCRIERVLLASDSPESQHSNYELRSAVSFSKFRISSICLSAFARLRPKVARSANWRKCVSPDFTE